MKIYCLWFCDEILQTFIFFYCIFTLFCTYPCQKTPLKVDILSFHFLTQYRPCVLEKWVLKLEKYVFGLLVSCFSLVICLWLQQQQQNHKQITWLKQSFQHKLSGGDVVEVMQQWCSSPYVSFYLWRFYLGFKIHSNVFMANIIKNIRPLNWPIRMKYFTELSLALCSTGKQNKAKQVLEQHEG